VALDAVEALPPDWLALLEDVLETCTEVSIVAAGRRPIGSRFEHRVALEPLRVAPAHGESEAPAVLHFLDCAERRFAGSRQVPLEPVRRVCQLLGGHPLAIDLATGWLRVLDIQSIRERLEHSLDLLVDTSLPPTARNASFAAVVDSSLQLASPAARAAFAVLAAFESPAKLEAAEAMGDVTLAAVGELESLGLVQSVEAPDGGARLSLLGAVREHARAQWTPEQRQALSDAHARTFLARAMAAGEDSLDSRAMTDLGDIALEFRDHVAAIAHETSAGRAVEALEHACVVGRLAEIGQHLTESVRLLEGALQGQVEDDALRLRALVRLARIHWNSGAFGRAKELATASVADGEKLGEQGLRMDAVAVLQAEAHRVGDYDLAHDLLQQSNSIAEAVGNTSGQARARLGMGNLRMEQGHFSEAQNEYLESLRLARKADARYWEVAALANLAHLAHLSQRDEAALGFIAQADEAASRSPSFTRLMHAVRSVHVHSLLSLGRTEAAEAALWTASHPWPEGTSARIEVLTAAADYFAATGQPERTAKIIGYLATITEEGGHAPGMEHQRRSAIGEKAAIALGEQRYAELYFAGCALTAEEAQQCADPGSVRNGVSVL
jgi:tetratricopeptide (TPR) repeat protein